MDQTFTILLVDDREENLLVLEEMLEADNRIFLKASSGNAALKTLLKHPEVGLILLDVQMPEMDGFEVARLLKLNPKTKDISIIFVTAISKEEKFMLRGFEEGAVDYMHKPLDVQVTKAKVKVFEQLYFYQSKLKQTASDLKKVNQQLERFTYVVSHDLKSPLASIIMLLDLCSKNESLADNPELQSQIEIACQVSNQLSDMINSILDYSRATLASQVEEEVHTFELVNEIAFMINHQQKITFNISESMPVIKTNKTKLQQVFQNLIGNAVKYNDKDKVLIEIGVSNKPDFYEFYVKDNGPGIAAQDNKRIFKLFEIAGNAAGTDNSTGVGLNLLKMLVEEQGGKIWVESVEGVGSTFFFEWRK